MLSASVAGLTSGFTSLPSSSPSLSALRTSAACSASALKSCWVRLGKVLRLAVDGDTQLFFLERDVQCLLHLAADSRISPDGVSFLFFYRESYRYPTRRQET